MPLRNTQPEPWRVRLATAAMIATATTTTMTQKTKAMQAPQTSTATTRKKSRGGRAALPYQLMIRTMTTTSSWMKMLMHLVPVLVSTEANYLDPVHVVHCLNRQGMTQPDLNETIFALVAARGQVIHSVWDGSYPAIDRGASPKVSVSSFTRALVVTAMGASGATVVACAGSAPAAVAEVTARKKRKDGQQAGGKRR